MPIIYHEQAKEFHLFNDEVSYIIGIMEKDGESVLWKSSQGQR